MEDLTAAKASPRTIAPIPTRYRHQTQVRASKMQNAVSQPKCPLCNSTETSHFDTHPKVDQHIHHCASCQFYFAFPHVPYVHSDHDEVEADAAAGYWTNEDAIKHYVAWREEENERLAAWTLESISPGRVLEIGVGDGPLTKRLAPKVGDYWGIEPDVNRLERARALLGDGENKILPIRSDEIDGAESLTRLYGTFDAVFLFSVLEHIPDPRHFFITARKLLKPSGRLIISVPNSTRFLLFYKLRKMMGVEPWTYFHISFFKEPNLRRALADEGFEIKLMRQHSLLNPSSIGYFQKRYRSWILGAAMRSFALLRLDRLFEMNTYFLVCEPAAVGRSSTAN